MCQKGIRLNHMLVFRGLICGSHFVEKKVGRFRFSLILILLDMINKNISMQFDRVYISEHMHVIRFLWNETIAEKFSISSPKFCAKQAGISANNHYILITVIYIGEIRYTHLWNVYIHCLAISHLSWNHNKIFINKKRNGIHM